jgi:hypothetical protein
MASRDRAAVIFRVASALDGIRKAGLLPIFFAERLLAGGAHPMAVLALSNWLHEDVLIERRDSRFDVAADLDVRAAELSALALHILDAGGWSSMLDDASRIERSAWNDALDSIRAAHQLEKPHPSPRGVELEVDMRGKVMTVRMDLSALVDDWSSDRVVAPGEYNDGWPIVTGQIFGDPRCEDGSAVTLYGVVSPDERTLTGMSMDYDLGRKAEAER